MQIRLYVDEDAIARTLVRGLRARGIDVTTVLDAGRSEQDDLAQLEHATQQGRVLERGANPALIPPVPPGEQWPIDVVDIGLGAIASGFRDHLHLAHASARALLVLPGGHVAR